MKVRDPRLGGIWDRKGTSGRGPRALTDCGALDQGCDAEDSPCSRAQQ